MTTGDTFASQGPSTAPPIIPGNGFGKRDGFWRRALRKRKDLPVWAEIIIVLVVIFFLLVVVRSFLFTAYYIPSGAMENTVQPGDRVLVNKVVYDFRAPERGEVVLFNDPNWTVENTSDSNASLFSKVGNGFGNLVGVGHMSAHDYIKRVIGVPGDYVACCDVNGNLTVNGASIDEPYVTLNAPIGDAASLSNRCGSVTVRNFQTVTVPAGELFVLGDHRLVSEDSRCAGMVPISDVIGKAEAVVWPTSRWTDLSTIPKAFHSVPPPAALGSTGPVRVSGGVSGGAVFAFPLLLAVSVPGRGRTRLVGMIARRRRRGPIGRNDRRTPGSPGRRPPASGDTSPRRRL